LPRQHVGVFVLADEDWIGTIVKFKSGRIGIVVSVQKTGGITFITVQVPGMGVITIRGDDVEKV